MMGIDSGHWMGAVPPQHIFANRKFVGVALEPPDFEGGSWIGAGGSIRDPSTGRFLLTARPRRAAGGARGYAANIYRSPDGEQYELIRSLPKEQIGELSDLDIHSIEGTRLLKDPLSGRWHLYLSANTDVEFVWGGLHWETLLLRAPDLEGPWESAGSVLRTDRDYDACQARDATIAIVDGRWFCLYKAWDGERVLRPALATSRDGVTWQKEGPLTVDGEDRHVFLNGGLFPGASGILFMGLEKQELTQSAAEDEESADEQGITHGGGPRRNFYAGLLDRRAGNIETVFRAPWEAGSEYEHERHPLLGYSSFVADPARDRLLMYVEAIDGELSRHMGLNGTVERLLAYESPLP